MRDHSPLGQWADRNPRVRWPLFWIALAALCFFAGWLQPTDF